MFLFNESATDSLIFDEESEFSLYFNEKKGLSCYCLVVLQDCRDVSINDAAHSTILYPLKQVAEVAPVCLPLELSAEFADVEILDGSMPLLVDSATVSMAVCDLSALALLEMVNSRVDILTNCEPIILAAPAIKVNTCCST